MTKREIDQGTIADMHDNMVAREEEKAKLRRQYAIFRHERFVGFCEGATAIEAVDTWVDTPLSDGTDLRRLPGPWSAVEKSEAIERGMI